jgi:hypothetical protein
MRFHPVALLCCRSMAVVMLAGCIDSTRDGPEPGANDGGTTCLPGDGWDLTVGGTDEDWGLGIAVDAATNVYVTGFLEGPGPVDLGGGARAGPSWGASFVASYGPDGAHRWDRLFEASSFDIAVGAGGNAYITGITVDSAPVDFGGGERTRTGFLVSYGPDGDYRWDRAFGPPAGGDRFLPLGFHTAVDGRGNAYVTGDFRGTADFGGGERTGSGGADRFVASYGPDGAHRWDTSEDGEWEATALDVDAAGNVYLVGDFGDGVVSYGPDGSHRWDRTFAARGLGIAVAAGGHVYVTGQFSGRANFGGENRASVGLRDIFVASYTATGDHRWDLTFGAPGEDNVGTAIAVDTRGHVYVTGGFGGSVNFGGGERTAAGESDIFVASYGAAGTYRWDRTFGGAERALGWAIAADAAGNAYVTGRFQGTVDLGNGARTAAGSWDVFLVSFCGS